MIIVTGPGRSGTSVIARLYKELGFDPGGRWNEGINAGLEAGDVVRVNNTIIRELGLGTLGPPQEGAQPPKLIANVWRQFVPQGLRERVRSSVHLLPFVSSRSPGFMRWDRVDEIAEEHHDELQRIASSYEVTKDPRFCWTLAVWAAAGVPIEHVLLCTRTLDGMVKSRSAAGHYRGRSDAGVKDSLVYGLGLCLGALYDYDLPYDIIRFPAFLENTDELYEAMRFPRPVEKADFIEALAIVSDRSLVHDQR